MVGKGLLLKRQKTEKETEMRDYSLFIRHATSTTLPLLSILAGCSAVRQKGPDAAEARPKKLI